MRLGGGTPSSALADQRRGRYQKRRRQLIAITSVAWASQASGTEGPDGLWDQIRTDAPRLQGKLRRLGSAQEPLTVEIARLRLGLVDADEDELKLVLLLASSSGVQAAS